MLERKSQITECVQREADGRPAPRTWLEPMGGNLAPFGQAAQLELSFRYLSPRRRGCYTRELWQ